MNKRKSHRVGERAVNRQGLTMEIVKYANNKNVEIVFVETGERRVVRYAQFKGRNVKADIINHPYLIVKHAQKCAKTTKIILSIVAVTALAALALKIFL